MQDVKLLFLPALFAEWFGVCTRSFISKWCSYLVGFHLWNALRLAVFYRGEMLISLRRVLSCLTEMLGVFFWWFVEVTLPNNQLYSWLWWPLELLEHHQTGSATIPLPSALRGSKEQSDSPQRVISGRTEDPKTAKEFAASSYLPGGQESGRAEGITQWA